jgi:hypothetical protein
MPTGLSMKPLRSCLALVLPLVLGCVGGAGRVGDGGVATGDAPAAQDHPAANAPGSGDAAAGGNSADAALLFPACRAPGMLIEGPERLVDVFAAGGDFIVVHDQAVVLLDRMGQVKHTRPFTRPVTGAAFDGKTLVVADALELALLDAALEPQGTIVLPAPCQGLTAVGGRVACAAETDLGYTSLATWDLTTRVRLGVTQLTEKSGSLRTVPGSTTDFLLRAGDQGNLLRIEPGGAVTDLVRLLLPDGPLTFAGKAPGYLVMSDGRMLGTLAPGCRAAGAGDESCLTRSAQLGTHWSPQQFVGMAEDPDGTLYGVTSEEQVPPDNALYVGTPPCRNGCAVQRIDVDRRLVVAERRHQLPRAEKVLKVVSDRGCNMVAVAYERTGGLQVSEHDGYRIDLLDYDQSPVPPPAPDAGTLPDLASPGGSGGGCGPVGTLAAGPRTLLDLFVLEKELMLVRNDAVVRLERDGTVHQVLASPRELTGAALDGQRLSVMDKAMITLYTPELAERTHTFTAQTCLSGDLFPGGKFFCGAQLEHGVAWMLFDLEASQALDYFFLAGPQSPLVRRLPGSDVYYDAGLALGVVGRGGTAVRSDTNTDGVFTFIGNPATHVAIGKTGQLLRIFGDGCQGMTNSFAAGCFVPEGELSTLKSGETFVALADGGGGKLLAVVNTKADTDEGHRCRKGGCFIQEIDLTTKTVLRQKTHALDLPATVRAWPDPTCGRLILGSQPGYAGSYGPYRVDSLDY